MTQPDTNTNVVLTADVSQYQQGMGQAGQSTDGLIEKLTRLNNAADNLFRKAGHKLEIVSAGSMAGIGAATVSLAQFDAQLRQVRATASLTGGTDVPKLANNIRAMGADIPVTTQELTSLATVIQGLGVKGAAQITALTKTFAELGAVTGESSAGLANSLIGLTRSMGNNLDPNQMKSYASAVANVAANLGTSATAVTQFAQAIQPLGKLLGLTETDLIGISGAFAKAGADGGPAFNAFNQMATLLINDLQTGNPQIKQFADLMGMTTASFEKMAKANPAEMINSVFNNLGSQGPKAIQFLQSIGIEGPRSVNAIQRVVQDGGIGQSRALAQMGAADPGKLTKAAGSAFNDLEAQLARLGHGINDLVTGPFEALQSVLTHIVRYVADVVGAFVKLGNLPGIHQFLQLMGGVATVVAPLLGVAGALITLIPLVAKLGFAWTLLFSRTNVSLLSGMKDSLSGVSRQAALAGRASALPASAAARAIAADRAYRAGTGPEAPRVGMTQRGVYRLGSIAGGGLYRILPHEQAAPGRFAPVDVGGLRRFGVQAATGSVRGAGWLVNEAYGRPIQRGTEGFRSLMRGPLDGPPQPWNATWAAQHAYGGGRYAFGSPDYWDRQRARGATLLSRVPGFGRPFQAAAAQAAASAAPGPAAGPIGTAVRAAPMAGSPLASPAFLRTTRSAEAMTKAFEETNKKIVAAGVATAAGTKAKVGETEAETAEAKAAGRAAVQNTEQAAASEKAAVSLGVLAREAAAATVGLAANSAAQIARTGGAIAGGAARGVGTMAARAGTGLMGALGGPWGLAITGALVGLPMLAGFLHSRSGPKNLSQETLDKSAGTFTGNINSMNTALGESTVSLNGLTKAARDAAAAASKTPSAPPPAAFSQDEVSKARDAAFKTAGYDAKSKATTAEKTAQLQLTEIGKITSGGKLGQSDIRQFRMQLEHLLPTTAEAKQVYDNLSDVTKGFTQAPKDLKSVQQIYSQLGKSYQENVVRGGGGKPTGPRYPGDSSTPTAENPYPHTPGLTGPGGRTPDQFHMIEGAFTAGAQRARALLANSLGYIGGRTSLGLPAQQAQTRAQFITGLVGEQRASGGNKVGQGFFFRDLAKNLGLPPSYGDATNLQDFVAKMFKSDRTTATRLFGAEGSIDFSQPGSKIINQAQKVYDQAQTQLSAQLKAQQSQSFSTYKLGDLGLARGGPAAGAVANVLGGSQKPEDMSRAVYGTAAALTKQGKSAAESQESLSRWIATVSSANGVAGPFAAQVQTVVDALNDMNRSTMSIPGQIKDIRDQMSKVDTSTAQGVDEYNKLYSQQSGLVQQGINQAQQYLLSQHQLHIQLERGQQDYQLQVTRNTEQFDLQQSRSLADYNKQVLRNQEAFNRQMARSQADFDQQQAYSQADYNKSRSRANRDFLYQETQYVKGVAGSLDPWSQVQAQSTTDAGQLLANLQQQGTMFKTAGSELDRLRKMGLNQNAIDVLGLSDPKNMQQLDRFYKDVAGNPKLINTFNSSIKGRLQWTKGLATDESSTQWRDMKHQFDQASKDAASDFDTAMTRSEQAFSRTMTRAHQDYKTATDQNADDFETATERSTTDFNTQMSNMQTDYEKSIKRSLEDVNDFATEAYGTANDIMAKALKLAKGNMHDFFAAASTDFHNMGDTMTGAAAPADKAGPAGSKDNPITSAGKLGVNPQGKIGTYSSSGKFTPLPSSHYISQSQANALPNIASPTSNVLPSGSSPTQNKAWAKRYMKAHYGWGDAEFSALESLWMHESGWRQTASNGNGGPDSGRAYGIPQSLPGDKMASFGSDWRTDAATQMKWGLNYIKNRYGDPTNAWAFWQHPTTPPTDQNWYAAGGLFNSGPRVIGVGERGPEAVIPLNQSGAQFLVDTMNRLNATALDSRMGNRYASKVETTVNNTHIDSSTNFNGEITVQAQDPNAMSNALKNKARMTALTNPDLATSGAWA